MYWGAPLRKSRYIRRDVNLCYLHPLWCESKETTNSATESQLQGRGWEMWSEEKETGKCRDRWGKQALDSFFWPPLNWAWRREWKRSVVKARGFHLTLTTQQSSQCGEDARGLNRPLRIEKALTSRLERQKNNATWMSGPQIHACFSFRRAALGIILCYAMPDFR